MSNLNESLSNYIKSLQKESRIAESVKQMKRVKSANESMDITESEFNYSDYWEVGKDLGSRKWYDKFATEKEAKSAYESQLSPKEKAQFKNVSTDEMLNKKFKLSGSSPYIIHYVDTTNEDLEEEFINESMQKLDDEMFATYSLIDVVTFIRNNSNSFQIRIVYDFPSGLYIIANGFDSIHYYMLKTAYDSGCYDDTKETLNDIESVGLQKYLSDKTCCIIIDRMKSDNDPFGGTGISYFYDSGLVVNVTTDNFNKLYQDMDIKKFFGKLVKVTKNGQEVENNTNECLVEESLDSDYAPDADDLNILNRFT